MSSNDEVAKLFVTLGLNATGYTEGMEKANKSPGTLADTWTKASAVITTSTVALELAARKQAVLTEQTQKLAASISITEGEMRKLAIETANVTFPLEEALATMEKGREQGIKSAEGLKSFATNWDLVADATGIGAAVLAESGIALRAVGIAAGDESQAMAAFGYITRETTVNVQEFLEFVGRTGEKLREMKLDVNDAAAIIGILEKEFGMTGRVARTEFQQAVNDSNGSLSAMLDLLGISEEKFNSYRQAVQSSNGVIEENARIHADSYTTLQKVKHELSEVTYGVGSYIGAIADLAPYPAAIVNSITLWGKLKDAIGFATIAQRANIIVTGIQIGFLGALSFAAHAATMATTALGFVMGVVTTPIFLVGLAIAAVIAAGYLLIKNWDDVKAAGSAALDWLGKKWTAFKDTAAFAINAVIDYINELIEKINKVGIVKIGIISHVGGGKTPGLAKGGTITAPGTVLVGEEGPELLSLPRGAQVTPLNKPAEASGIDYGRMASAIAQALSGAIFVTDLDSGKVELIVQDAFRREVRI
ncbi:hypothetical protein [Desulforamulus aquiferis]|uniref:Tail tape measure protein n=1 Tax=Desulforamulus aquiferis TaxID=1397668 RepID=A0AAW7Z8H7_9FIRM|nr:hypothetical protein [Desulforamulus aquiferis]MDO7786098.1 hypothetical protein [Desulforamulus aquiferis]